MKTFQSILFAVALIAGSLSFTSCEKITGEGPVVTAELDIDYFTGVRNNTSDAVTITYGEELKVIAKGESNIISKIKTDVNNGVWNFELESGNYRNYSLKIEITMPVLYYVQMNGSGTLDVSSFTANDNTNDLYVSNNGSGRVNVTKMHAYENLEASVQGSGSIQISSSSFDGDMVALENKGSGRLRITTSDIMANSLDAKLAGSGGIYIESSEASEFEMANLNSSGSGEINIIGCTVEKCTSSQSGSGSVYAHVDEELSVRIDGSGNFKYSGDAKIIGQQINGSGRLVKM